jgi:hypothetical protein
LYALQEVPFAENRLIRLRWEKEVITETRRDIEASKWATRTLKKFKE